MFRYEQIGLFINLRLIFNLDLVKNTFFLNQVNLSDMVLTEILIEYTKDILEN